MADTSNRSPQANFYTLPLHTLYCICSFNFLCLNHSLVKYFTTHVTIATQNFICIKEKGFSNDKSNALQFKFLVTISFPMTNKIHYSLNCC